MPPKSDPAKEAATKAPTAPVASTGEPDRNFFAGRTQAELDELDTAGGEGSEGDRPPNKNAKRKFGAAKRRITMLRAELRPPPGKPWPTLTIPYLKAKLDAMDYAKKELTLKFDAAVDTLETQEQWNALQGQLEDYESRADDLLVYMKTALAELEEAALLSADTTNVETFTSALQNTAGKLPQLELLKFDGSLEANFLAFIDSFRASVHNRKDLRDIQKMTYLQSSLTGDAKECIKGIPLSNIGYQTALTAVIERYGRKRAMVTNIIREVIDYPVASSKKELLDLFTFIRGRKCLLDQISSDFNTIGSNLILQTLLEHKLPYSTREEWEVEVAKAEKGQDPEKFQVHLPLEELFIFLQQRAQAGELTRRSRRPAAKDQNQGGKTEEKKNVVRKEKALTANSGGGGGQRRQQQQQPPQQQEKPKCLVCDSSTHLTDTCLEATKIDRTELW